MTSNAEKGFTLIEALVAMTILVLALTVFYRALGDGMRGWSVASAREETLLHALAHLERLGVDIALSSGEGRYADGTAWNLRVVPLASAAPPARPVYWVELKVVGGHGAMLLSLATARIDEVAHE